MAVNQPYVVLKQESRTSKISGQPMTKITLLGVKDRKEYVTYIDSPNKNHKHWQHIIENPTHGFVLRNLKVKRYKDRELIDADSRVIIEWEDVDDVEILRQMAEIWAEEELRNETDSFRVLSK